MHLNEPYPAGFGGPYLAAPVRGYERESVTYLPRAEGTREWLHGRTRVSIVAVADSDRSSLSIRLPDFRPE